MANHRAGLHSPGKGHTDLPASDGHAIPPDQRKQPETSSADLRFQVCGLFGGGVPGAVFYRRVSVRHRYYALNHLHYLTASTKVQR